MCIKKQLAHQKSFKMIILSYITTNIFLLHWNQTR